MDEIIHNHMPRFSVTNSWGENSYLPCRHPCNTMCNLHAVQTNTIFEFIFIHFFSASA